MNKIVLIFSDKLNFNNRTKNINLCEIITIIIQSSNDKQAIRNKKIIRFTIGLQF